MSTSAGNFSLLTYNWLDLRVFFIYLKNGEIGLGQIIMLKILHLA